MSYPDNNASANVNPTENNEIEIDDHAPLWKYVKKLDKLGKGGGNTMFKCNYCHNTYKGSYSRVKFHLLKISGNGIAPCEMVTDEVFAEMKKLVRECEYRLKSAAPRQVSLPNTSSLLCSSVSNVEQKKRKGMNGPLDRAFQNEPREQCDAEVARMFYTGGLSFHLARNPHYRDSYFRASTLPGYVPPGYNALRTTLLQQEKRHVERCLQPIKSTWSTKGVSVCSDGWTDSQRRPLINIMATCESGPMFLKGINCDEEYKDKYCIANFLIDAIKEIGYQNMVQVITDNALVCRAAGLLVEARYPNIFWTPCVVHTLNLALKSICSPKPNDDWYDKCSWISEIAADVGSIKIFIVNHNMILTMYKDHCKLKLLSIAETRFASRLVMIRRFKEVKEGLEQMVISPNWSLYKEDDVSKARRVKEKILDEYFWDEIDYILSFTASIFEMIRMADTDKPSLHLVYEWWDTMIEKVKAAIYRKEHKQLHEESDFFDVVYQIILERWTKSSTPLHCLAHSLNPKKSPSYKEGVTQMWDIGGDGFDNLGEEGVGMLEIANLSLDEPSLEVALFTGEDIINIVVD
ncbi:uncharacterized protein LOC109950316 [Prunus persica]|uniref:uncharacterized protein LOC109950316 n=1 Tax=Prunus persica TaxID=3760 RepID=UPI0009AB307A|nr:uncharacterized protein LOC109950316 [Prunus persica]